jgi:transposase
MTEVSRKIYRECEKHIPRKSRNFQYAGRKPQDDFKTVNGIVYVLRRGIAWTDLPLGKGYGSGVTCFRRVQEWREDGTLQKIQRTLTDHLVDGDMINWGRAYHKRSFRKVRRGEVIDV